MKKDETLLTSGMIIRAAREEKKMSINDLAFEISKNKEDVKRYEKKIDAWEKDKAYPNMNEIYLLANSIGINPTDLMILRDRHRKTLAKKDVKKKCSRIDVDELKEYLYYIAAFLAKFVSFLVIIVVSVVFCRLIKTAVERSPNDVNSFGNEVGNVITDYMDNIHNKTNEINETNNIIKNDENITNEIGNYID